MKGIDVLYRVYKNETSWIKPNLKVFELAKKNNLILGGSIGISIGKNKFYKEPNDIDFFTNNYAEALGFVSDVLLFLSKSKVYYKVLINNHTDILLPNVTHWFKIIIPFWLPICVMVKSKQISKLNIDDFCVQDFNEIIKSAKDTSARDGKERDYDNDSDYDYDNDDDDDFWEMNTNKKINKEEFVFPFS